MNKQSLLASALFLSACLALPGQGFIMTPPRLTFDGNQLQIYYDIISKSPRDQFYTWLEIKRSDGQSVIAKNLQGDIGDKIKGGNNRKITWLPRQDSVYIDDEISIEVKAEKYSREFNKCGMLARSAIFPGWGQAKISKGKPYWIAGILFYGSIGAGYMSYKNYVDTYNAYKTEEDPVKRLDLKKKSQDQLNLASAIIISGAGLWAVNMIWVAATPNGYHLPQHVSLTLTDPSHSGYPVAVISFKTEF